MGGGELLLGGGGGGNPGATVIFIGTHSFEEVHGVVVEESGERDLRILDGVEQFLFILPTKRRLHGRGGG